MITAMLLGLLVQSGSTPSNRFPMDDWISARTCELVTPYWYCAWKEAEVLEPSGEDASTVVAASLEACRSERGDLQAALDVDAILSKRPAKLADDVMQRFDAEVKSWVALQIVKIRSDRNR